MRDYIAFFLNGELQTVRGRDAFLTLSDFLRLRKGMVGTKIVCSEGDCGSCSVLCGFPVSRDASPTANLGETGSSNGQPSVKTGFKYRSLDSCIRFVFQLDGVHVVTVEGLADQKNGSLQKCLSGVQQAMVDCHGSQCGFCTPGFVMAMTGMLQEKSELSVDEIRHGLTGNLCRCTGYSPIITAALQENVERGANLNEKFPAQPMLQTLANSIEDKIEISAPANDVAAAARVFCPTSVESAVKILAQHPTARIIAGATDLGVQFNKGHLNDSTFIDLNRVAELTQISATESKIIAGARATWADLESVLTDTVPQFKEIVSVFGSPQIRHVGTIGGNIINASPIADSIPLLFLCDALLTLTSDKGQRSVNINNFYFEYKSFDLQPGELLTKIEIPLPKNIETMRLYKISRRRDLDISTFTAAIQIESEKGLIRTARVAFGAVGPTVIRMKKTELFLLGKPFDLETLKAAGEVAVSEITPLTDVRGSADYRYNLARNVLQKYYYQSREATAAT